jgi:cell division protein FtsB
VRAFLLCGFIALSGVGYVWQKSRIDELSKQIKEREQKLAALKASNDKLRKQLATLHSPPSLMARINELKLGLVPATPKQVWRLTEPSAELEATPSATNLQFAAGRDPSPRAP